MTATAHEAETKNDIPNAPLAELKGRFPHVRTPILMALHILTQNPNIEIADAKAQANVHGVRITAASVTAAQRLMSKMEAALPALAAAPAATTAPTPPARRPRAIEATQDAEALIKGVVAKLANQGNAEAERLRASIRRAIDLLGAALG
jgi:plasmid stabilization system protein ParE